MIREFVIFFFTVTTKQVIRLSLRKTNSSLDLNDPAVMESILKQVNHVFYFNAKTEQLNDS